MKTSTPDDRVNPRYPASFLLYHAGESSFGYSYTRNISDGGCFVETEAPLARGVHVDIEMYVDLGAKAMPLVAGVEVMWANATNPEAKRGMGLRFVSMEEDARRLLERALEILSSPQLPIPSLAE